MRNYVIVDVLFHVQDGDSSRHLPGRDGDRAGVAKGAKRRTLKNELLFLAFLVLRFLVRIMPERLGDLLGRAIGRFSYLFLPNRRRVAVANIRAALGLPEGEAIRLAKETFAHLVLLGVEFIRFAGRREAIRERVTFRGEEHLRQALALGRGAIILHAHLGNWELAGQALGFAGYKVHPVVKEQKNDRFFSIVEHYREASGLAPIVLGFTLREMLHALRRGECVLIMPDQGAGRHGVIVPFFGHPASTPRGIAVVARLSGAPVVPVFIRRVRPGHHQVRCCPPLEMACTGDEDADTRENLIRINTLLEAEIREYPEQWLWMHRRWKSGKRPGRHRIRRRT